MFAENNRLGSVPLGLSPLLVSLALQVDLGSGVYAVQVKAAHRHTCVLLNDGGLKCWGFNENGEVNAASTATVIGASPGCNVREQKPSALRPSRVKFA